MPETFGKTDIGSDPEDKGANWIFLDKFISGSAGTLSKLSVYCKAISGTANIKCAIYDASYNLLTDGITEELQIGTTKAWHDFSFSIPPSIAASTYYYLCWWSDSSIRIYRQTSGGYLRYANYIYNTWPNPISSAYYGPIWHSIYATYTGPPSPPGPPTDLLCNDQVNPVDVIPSYFSAIYNDPNPGDIAKYYQIQVNDNMGFTGKVMWNSGKTAMSDVTEGQRCGNIFYNGQALSLNKIKYYWRIKFWDDEDQEGAWSAAANFTMAGGATGEAGAAPWDEEVPEPTGVVKVEIPRRSGQWTTLGDVMRIHTSVNKNPLDAVEIAQAEVTLSNISKNFNSFESASQWYKQLEGYAVEVSVGCDIGGTPISQKLFTGIISKVEVDRLKQTAEINVVDFLDYFKRLTIESTPLWENISLTQLYKNLVGLVFPDWVENIDYFVEDLGNITVPAISYKNLNFFNELKRIAESRGKRLYTDINGKLVCRSRSAIGEPWDIRHDYNLEKAKERRDIDGIINWVIVHARPYEVAPPPAVPPTPEEEWDQIVEDTGRKEIKRMTFVGPYEPLNPLNPGEYGKSHIVRLHISFKDFGAYSLDWLRFRYAWDIDVTSGPKYPSSAKHIIGETLDLLPFNFQVNPDNAGVVYVYNVLISATASEILVDHKVQYAGGMAKYIKISNTLILYG